ncbi:LRRN4 C-terminal-like protein isoform X2 [Austrofundulus limnaeus]|uniref:LRRN4 C-terminal-like protein isoform X2 n=1 Tax=Austrofundulus limnaeus TaxID=52670 RepID=A0A2I4B2U3_AUSLI|nr:PREDICTED: LRRN4 C-terminal-like protein isoform X2 [Austrofundulus limnaeus]
MNMTNPTMKLQFSFLIFCLVSSRGYCLKPTSSGATETPPSFYVDYEYEDTTPAPAPGRGSLKPGTSQHCDYDPCRDNQTPCMDLSLLTGCLCRGLTLYTELPEAPRIQSVFHNGSGVLVWWCAPYSYVTAYTVTVGGLERQSFGAGERRALLGEIAAEEEVCIVSRNDVGNSNSTCEKYRPKGGKRPLTGWLIGGAGGLLLLVLLAAMLWRHRRQKKQETGDV